VMTEVVVKAEPRNQALVKMVDADSAFLSCNVPVLPRAINKMQTVGPYTVYVASLDSVYSPARYPSEFGF
jgi:hypothetical protein